MQFYLAFPFIYLGMRRYGCLKVSLTLAVASIIVVYVMNKIAWLQGIGLVYRAIIIVYKAPLFFDRNSFI